MRVALGMLARSDRTKELYLNRVLEIMSPSFDGVEIREDHGVPIEDFAAARNEIIEAAERDGFDWLFMLDSDECMFPSDIEAVKSHMTPDQRLIVLPRIEFVKDLDHWDPTGYPDYQGRVFRLGMGYRYRRRVHEGLYRRFSPVSEMRLKRGYHSDDTPIYHYGRVKTAEELVLKFHNYDLIAEGKAPVKALPAELAHVDGTHRWGNMTRFEKPHPLADANVVPLAGPQTGDESP